MYKRSSGKGISVFTSHVIAIAILFAILIIIASGMYSYYYSVRGETQQSQARVLSKRIADNVISLYTTYKESDYDPYQNTTLSVVYVNIPEKISGSSYELSLEQHKDFWIEGDVENESSHDNERPYTFVKVETDSFTHYQPIYNIISAKVSGSVRKATKVKLSYVRGKGEDFIKMERFE